MLDGQVKVKRVLQKVKQNMLLKKAEVEMRILAMIRSKVLVQKAGRKYHQSKEEKEKQALRLQEAEVNVVVVEADLVGDVVEEVEEAAMVREESLEQATEVVNKNQARQPVLARQLEERVNFTSIRKRGFLFDHYQFHTNSVSFLCRIYSRVYMIRFY